MTATIIDTRYRYEKAGVGLKYQNQMLITEEWSIFTPFATVPIKFPTSFSYFNIEEFIEGGYKLKFDNACLVYTHLENFLNIHPLSFIVEGWKLRVRNKLNTDDSRRIPSLKKCIKKNWTEFEAYTITNRSITKTGAKFNNVCAQILHVNANQGNPLKISQEFQNSPKYQELIGKVKDFRGDAYAFSSWSNECNPLCKGFSEVLDLLCVLTECGCFQAYALLKTCDVHYSANESQRHWFEKKHKHQNFDHLLSNDRLFNAVESLPDGRNKVSQACIQFESLNYLDDFEDMIFNLMEQEKRMIAWCDGVKQLSQKKVEVLKNYKDTVGSLDDIDLDLFFTHFSSEGEYLA